MQNTTNKNMSESSRRAWLKSLAYAEAYGMGILGLFNQFGLPVDATSDGKPIDRALLLPPPQVRL